MNTGEILETVFNRGVKVWLQKVKVLLKGKECQLYPKRIMKLIYVYSIINVLAINSILMGINSDSAHKCRCF